MSTFVSRAGLKLDHALNVFKIDVTGWVCADLGCNTGGFVDCLLQRGAAKVYAIDTGYGVLDWKLRKDPRVIVMERTNALHAELPELVQLVTIDVAWTKQKHIIPPATRMLKPGGWIVSLIKPHYEAEASLLVKGVLPAGEVESVVNQVKTNVEGADVEVIQTVLSPIKGAKGNVEVLAKLRAAKPL